jgi:Spy/CpxP family protein refolding chaperone
MTSRGLIVLLLSLLLGVAGFSLVRWHQHMTHHHPEESVGYAQHGAEGHHAELDWLRHELAVTDAQMEKIRSLHVAYHPICESLTKQLEDSHAKLDALTLRATTVSPELDAALKEHSAIHLECQRVMLKHLYDTAGCLSPEQAQTYLKEMLPQVFRHDDLSAGENSGHAH